MSRISNILRKNGIRLVAIGFDINGYESFLRGGYLSGGDLYIDKESKAYKALKLNRAGQLKVIYDCFLSKKVREWMLILFLSSS